VLPSAFTVQLQEGGRQSVVLTKEAKQKHCKKNPDGHVEGAEPAEQLVFVSGTLKLKIM
jgi:hypothetical protein